MEDPQIGDSVTVKAPARLFGTTIMSFGPDDVTGEITYVHPFLTISYVVASTGEGYVDNASLEAAT